MKFDMTPAQYNALLANIPAALAPFGAGDIGHSKQLDVAARLMGYNNHGHYLSSQPGATSTRVQAPVIDSSDVPGFAVRAEQEAMIYLTGQALFCAQVHSVHAQIDGRAMFVEFHTLNNHPLYPHSFKGYPEDVAGFGKAQTLCVDSPSPNFQAATYAVLTPSDAVLMYTVDHFAPETDDSEGDIRQVRWFPSVDAFEAEDNGFSHASVFAALRGEIAPKVVTPTPPVIRARLKTDDDGMEVDFDAAPFFQHATERGDLADILETLEREAFRAGEISDGVAEFFINGPCREVYDYLGAVNKGRHDVGSTCEIERDDVLEWLKINRPEEVAVLEPTYKGPAIRAVCRSEDGKASVSLDVSAFFEEALAQGETFGGVLDALAACDFAGSDATGEVARFFADAKTWRVFDYLSTTRAGGAPVGFSCEIVKTDVMTWVQTHCPEHLGRIDPQTCPHCGSDLSEDATVRRTYVNKDDEDGDVSGLGHYNTEGQYEPDRFDGFGDGRFDLRDDSDTCAHCDGAL